MAHCPQSGASPAETLSRAPGPCPRSHRGRQGSTPVAGGLKSPFPSRLLSGSGALSVTGTRPPSPTCGSLQTPNTTAAYICKACNRDSAGKEPTTTHGTRPWERYLSPLPCFSGYRRALHRTLRCHRLEISGTMLAFCSPPRTMTVPSEGYESVIGHGNVRICKCFSFCFACWEAQSQRRGPPVARV